MVLPVCEDKSIALAAAQTEARSHDLDMVKTDSVYGTGPTRVENRVALPPDTEGLPHNHAAHTDRRGITNLETMK